MAHWKDNWKTLYVTDQDWLRASREGDEVVLEHAEEVGEYEDDEGFTQGKFQIYRFDIEKWKLVSDPSDPLRAYLVPESYDPKSWPHPLSDYEAWFAQRDNLQSVAQSAGYGAVELAEAFTSNDPRIRTEAYQAVAGHFGYAEFDDDPLEATEPVLDARWK